jgi:hypothetical protein
MATEAAELNGKRLTERKKGKCALTSTGLLMEGVSKLVAVKLDSRLAPAPGITKFGFEGSAVRAPIDQLRRIITLSPAMPPKS